VAFLRAGLCEGGTRLALCADGTRLGGCEEDPDEPGVFGCRGTASLRECTGTYEMPQWYEQCVHAYNDYPLDARAIRVRGSYRYRYYSEGWSPSAGVFVRQDQDDTTTFDEVRGFYPQWGRPATDAELLADSGASGALVSRNDLDASSVVPGLFLTTYFYRDNRDPAGNPTAQIPTGMRASVAGLLTGPISSLIVTNQFPVIPEAETESSSQASRVYERISNVIAMSVGSLQENYFKLREFTSFFDGYTIIQDREQRDTDMRSTILARFNDLPAAWLGPPGFNLCETIATALAARATGSADSPEPNVDPNADAIDDFNARDPGRRGGCCG
jgi:hypothetical protein